MAHDSDKDKDKGDKGDKDDKDKGEKDKQKCLSASGNKKCVCHKKTTGVDVCEIDD